MGIGWAIAGGLFGRMNEIVKEEKALELAKAKAAKKDGGLKIIDMFKSETGTEMIKNGNLNNFFNLVLAGQIDGANASDLAAAGEALNMANENMIHFGSGNNKISFMGYTGPKEEGSFERAAGNLTGLNKFLTTSENQQKFFNLMQSDERAKRSFESMILPAMTYYNLGFTEKFSGKQGQAWGKVMPMISKIFPNFNTEYTSSLFGEYHKEGGGQIGDKNVVAGISDDGKKLLIKTASKISQDKYNDGFTLPHYELYELDLASINPGMNAEKSILVLQEMAEKLDKTLPEFLATLAPDTAKYNNKDYKGAFQHVGLAIDLNKTNIASLDPNQGSAIQLSAGEKQEILDILFAKAGSSTRSTIDFATAQKAVALHMSANYPEGQMDTTQTTHGTINDYVSSLSGLKMKDIQEGQKNAQLALDRLQALEEIMLKTNKVGFSADLTRGLLGIFGRTGQVAQLAGTLNFNENADRSGVSDGSTYNSTISYYQGQIDQAGGLETELGRAKALEISLAFALARAEDPSGRLSNQDIEAQLARIGAGKLTSIDTALGAIRQTMNDTTDLLNYYNLFNKKGDDEVTGEMQRQIDAAVVVRSLMKEHNRNVGVTRSLSISADEPTDLDNFVSSTAVQNVGPSGRATQPSILNNSISRLALNQTLASYRKDPNDPNSTATTIFKVNQLPSSQITQPVIIDNINDPDNFFTMKLPSGASIVLPKNQFAVADPNKPNEFILQ